MIGEIGVAYLIYFVLQKHIDKILKVIFYTFFKTKIPYINNLFLIAFSFGIYKHLKKSDKKADYFKNKMIQFYNKKK
jgi:hypothetical protein